MKLATAPALVLALASGGARADDERALSGGVHFATFSLPGKAERNMTPPEVTPSGGEALSLTYERAFGGDLSLRAELAGGLFHGGEQKDEGSLSYALVGDVGASFRFDVLRWVPYAFAGVGGIVSGGGPIGATGQDTLDVVLVVGGGLDRLISRRRSIGAELRLASFGSDITVMTIGVRGTVRWGFF